MPESGKAGHETIAHSPFGGGVEAPRKALVISRPETVRTTYDYVDRFKLFCRALKGKTNSKLLAKPSASNRRVARSAWVLII